jgi:hypothetical protein
MLVAAMMWTALPGFACFLSMPQPTAQSSCCHKMAEDCGSMESMGAMESTGSAEMCADPSCCQLHEQSIGLVPVLAYAPEQLQKLAVAPAQFLLPALAEARNGLRNRFETPPPKSSSGVSSILRV